MAWWKRSRQAVTTCLAGGEVVEDEAGERGAEQLRRPVEDGARDADVAADGERERHGGVDVAARDVGRDEHRSEEPERLGHGGGHQRGGVGRDDVGGDHACMQANTHSETKRARVRLAGQTG
jgi:hypothetical protein